MNKHTLANILDDLEKISSTVWKQPGLQWLGVALDEIIKRVKIALGEMK